MSRNLLQTDCACCPAPFVALVERPRPITEDECGVYYSNFAGMLVANAECPACGAKYLAWVDERGSNSRVRHGQRFADVRIDELPYFDLSFRSTFNDEPGRDDLPRRRVEVYYVPTEEITYCHHDMDLDCDPPCSRCVFEKRVRLAEQLGEWSVFWVPKVGDPTPCVDLKNFHESATDDRLLRDLARWNLSDLSRGRYEIRQNRKVEP